MVYYVGYLSWIGYTIIDTTSYFSKYLINNSISSSDVELSNIILLYIDEKNFKRLRKLGYNVISYFGCMEFGFIGYSINNIDNRFLLTSDCYLDKQIAQQQNLLVMTGMIGEFPLIKYSTNDKISIEKDMEKQRTILAYHGRNTTIAVPDASEGNFSFEEATKTLEDSHSYINDFMMVAYKINEGILEKNIIATFIDCDMKINIEQIRHDIMVSGFGAYIKEYAKYFPVYQVEKSIINKLGRNKHFINMTFENHPRTKTFSSLTRLVKNDYKLVKENRNE